MDDGQLPFDEDFYRMMNEQRGRWLRRVLPALAEDGQLSSALDAGAGLGYFSGLLANEFGLEVTAFDARPENVALGSERHPGVRFVVDDVEGFHSLAGQSWDLVLCFGLLYHLENPFRAIRNLRAATRRYLLLESKVAPGGVAANLVDERPGPDKSLHFIALVPAEDALAKMLYAAGFAAVYRASQLPDAPDFRGSLLRRRVRTIMLATTDGHQNARGLERAGFAYVAEPGIVRIHEIGFRGRRLTRWLHRWRSRLRQQTSPVAGQGSKVSLAATTRPITDESASARGAPAALQVDAPGPGRRRPTRR